MNMTEIRALSADEVVEKLETISKEIFQLRFKKSLHQLENPAQIRTLKHQYSQLKTVLNEKRKATV